MSLQLSRWHFLAVGSVLALVAVVLALTGVFASHASGTSTASAKQTSTASAERDPRATAQLSSTILIGSIGGTSGSYASSGVAALDGELLAVSDLNRHGGVLGKPLTLQSYDDQASPKLAVSLFLRLVKAGAVAVIGSADSGTATGATADQLHIPDLGVVNTSRGAFPWVWNSGPGAGAAAAVDAAYALKSCNGLALLSGSSAGDGAGVAVVKDAYGRAHKLLRLDDTVNESSPTGAPVSLAKQSALIKASGAGCVIAWLSAPDTASLAQTLRAAHANVTLIGDSAIASNTTFELLAGAAAGGTLSTELTAQAHPGAALAKFAKSFLAKFHTAPTADAIANYDAVLMLAAAIKQEHSTSPPKLQAALNSLSGSELQGTVTFTKADHVAVSAGQLTLVSYNAAAKAWKPVS